MDHAQQIKQTFERAVKAVSARPRFGQGTEIMSVDMDQFGCCRIDEDDVQIEIDLSNELGGNGTTPSAGYFAKAALGACLAQGYHIHAALLGITINSLRIQLESDYDLRGNLGIDSSVPKSYSEVRYRAFIDSPDEPEKLAELIERSDRLDWVRDIFATAIPLRRELQVNGEKVRIG
jgi:uncharacterized OsmC-like protein